jgi:hypothetical protein
MSLRLMTPIERLSASEVCSECGEAADHQLNDEFFCNSCASDPANAEAYGYDIADWVDAYPPAAFEEIPIHTAAPQPLRPAPIYTHRPIAIDFVKGEMVIDLDSEQNNIELVRVYESLNRIIERPERLAAMLNWVTDNVSDDEQDAAGVALGEFLGGIIRELAEQGIEVRI